LYFFGQAVCASVCAAVAYTTAAAPVDLVRSRLMAAAATTADTPEPGGGGSGIGRSARPDTAGAFAMCAAVVQREGIIVLWRGWGPATASLVPVVVLVFPLMERLRSILGVGLY
jgi:hypothetical protein